MATKVKLKDVRLSFPDLFEPVQYQGKGAFRYNASFLIVRGSENDKAVNAAIKAEVAAEFPDPVKAAKFLESVKGNSNKMCYTSGDLKEYEGYAGMVVLTSHRQQKAGRPTVIDGNKAPLTAQDGKPYAGCYVNASVDIYVQTGENPGIRCGLAGVQFSKDGDAFSGGRAASPDEFEDIADGAQAGAPGGDASDDSLA